jgi:hypothetical protein
VLRSNIPDRAGLEGGTLSLARIPNTGPPTPVQDAAGDDWGWGTGAEVGLRFGGNGPLGVLGSMQGIYQDIYGGNTAGMVWTWHAGVSYGFGGGAR